MKYFSIVFGALLISCALFATPSHATFPNADISQWNTKEVQELDDPDYASARELVHQKNIRKLDLLNTKIEHYPREATPVYLKASTLIEMGKYKEASVVLTQAYKMEQYHPAAHYTFCQLHREMGKGESSLRSCVITAQQHPDSAQALYEYSVTLNALGQMEKANTQLLKAEQLDPGNPEYSYQIGLNYSYLNDNAQAEQAFLNALRIDSKHLNSLYQIAYLYAAQGKSEQAMSYLKQLLDSNEVFPKQESAERLLDYIKKGETSKLPLKIVPHNYHVGRSKSFYQSKKYGPALIEIETAARLRPNDPSILEIKIGVSSFLLRLKETEDTINQLLEVIGNNPQISARSFQEMGDVQLMRGNLEMAKKLYEKAKTLDDPNGISRISLDEFPDMDAKPFPEKLENELFIDPAEALNKKGEVFLFYGMYERALANFSLALKVQPNHLFSILNTATAYKKSGQRNRAISILEGLLVSQPKHAYLSAHLLLLGQCYFEAGNSAKGITHIENAIAISPQIRQLIQEDPAYEQIKESAAFKDKFPE